jgi:hypothetical protein
MADAALPRAAESREKMWEEMVIHVVLAIVRGSIKNPVRAAALQTLLIEVRDAINSLYPGA